MKTLFDVQQLLKHFGIYIYIGKRLYDIEMMKIELQRLFDNGLIEKNDYLNAELILRREHRLELEKEGRKNEL
ncbi:YqgQ family protein [Streptococcus uberis]|nr:YqgQ family protein [Streptococcus uberis]MCK1256547.1 YqgQ family protein [Streptococcus uberis]MCK1258188.1 YqgQ family protein [Streptococcus uberis]